MLNPDDFKKAILSIDALGATPAVLVKVAELANDTNTDLADICEFLCYDGPLAADIIRISNSPYYAPATFHSNLTSAINCVGLREVRRIVNLSLAQQLFARNLPGYGLSARDYWSDSVAAALVMEALARHTGLNPEDAYTIGILHAIGRVLINHVIDEQGFSIYWDGKQPIEEWEKSAVGFDYAQAGAMLLEHWNFPPASCDVIRWQLKSEKALEQVSLLGSLQFTERLLALSGLDFENKDWQLPEADPFMTASGLTQALAIEIVSACRGDFQRILQSVDMR